MSVRLRLPPGYAWQFCPVPDAPPNPDDPDAPTPRVPPDPTRPPGERDDLPPPTPPTEPRPVPVYDPPAEPVQPPMVVRSAFPRDGLRDTTRCVLSSRATRRPARDRRQAVPVAVERRRPRHPRWLVTQPTR